MYSNISLRTVLFYLEIEKMHMEPEYVDHQFQCEHLDFMVDVVLPGSSLCSVFADVSAACTATLIQVKMYLQRHTPAKPTHIALTRRNADITLSKLQVQIHIIYF